MAQRSWYIPPYWYIPRTSPNDIPGILVDKIVEREGDTPWQ
jgi:hypothetical protein